MQTPHRTRHIDDIASLSCALCRPACSPLKHAHSDATERTCHSKTEEHHHQSQAAGGHERTRAGGSWCNDADCGKSVKHLAWRTRLSRDLSVLPPSLKPGRPAMRANTVLARVGSGKSKTTRAIDIAKGCQLLASRCGCRASDALYPELRAVVSRYSGTLALRKLELGVLS